METIDNRPVQENLPLASVQGQPLTELPRDLYIPPDALEVFLETFEGPLDLLLYLIRKQNLDILDIPIQRITEQYMDYIAMMREMRFELAAEYLLMAAILAEIKSRMLLPRPTGQDEDEEDPRAELIRRLQEYERYKQAAEELDALPRELRDFMSARISDEQIPRTRLLPEVSVDDLLEAMRGVLARADLRTRHQVQREALSVRETMSRILQRLQKQNFTEFTRLLPASAGRPGVVVHFLAILELARENLLELVQNAPLSPIYVRLKNTHG